MTREEYLKMHSDFCELLKTISRNKNTDYTSGAATDDAFANFKQVEALGICSTEQGFLARMTDKMSRINSFVKRGVLEVKDESIQDTLLDLANYSMLMAAYIQDKKNQNRCLVTKATAEGKNESYERAEGLKKDWAHDFLRGIEMRLNDEALESAMKEIKEFNENKQETK